MDLIQGLLDNLNLDTREQGYKPSFIARCYCCKAPHHDINKPLKRCGGCQLVSYCNRDCQMQDRPDHKEFCKTFKVVNGRNALFTTGSWDVHIRGLRDRAARLSFSDENENILLHPRVCNICHESNHTILTDCKCAHVAYCSTKCASADVSHKKNCQKLEKEENDFSYHLIQKAYAMSLKFALAFMSKCEIGVKRQWLFDVSSLTIHVVSSNPMLDSYYWEVAFLHTPKLKHLEIVFIIPDKKYTPDKNFDFSKTNNKLNYPLCATCKAKKRTVKYSIQEMEYHEYFSSLDYTDPDVVVVYGISGEMPLIDESSHIQHELSYRNMIHNSHTVLVLMDAAEHLLKMGAQTFYFCERVEEIIKPMVNEDRGFTEDGINDKYYFTCLRKTVPWVPAFSI